MGLQQLAGRDYVLSIVEFKATKSSVKSTGNPHTAKIDHFHNRKFSVGFCRVRISRTFDTWFSNSLLYSIGSKLSLTAGY